LIFQRLPGEADTANPELGVGLDAISDRIFFVSYSSRQACLSAPLAESSARSSRVPPSSTPPASYPVESSLLLTTDDLTRMTTFWAAFLQQPPSIRDIARRQLQTSFTLEFNVGLVTRQSMTLGVVDLETLAARYPTVAADFVRAGLTPHRWTQLRAALFAAILSEQLKQLQGGGVSVGSSVVRKNMALLRAHPDALKALRATGMWLPTLPEHVDCGGDLDP
jgi:hypothetical protein